MTGRLNILQLAGLVWLACATAVPAAEKTPEEIRLMTEVESALVGLGSRDLNVDVRGGIVQIAGFVDSFEARNAAENAVATVRGVDRVSNKMVVQQALRSASGALQDNITRGRIRAALTGHEATSGFDINVEVSDGIVLLSGFVNSIEELDTASQIAAEAEGVQRVVNGLDVVPLE